MSNSVSNVANVSAVSLSAKINKHFLMVAPDGYSIPVPPSDAFQFRQRWEALKSAVESTGAKLTIYDSKQENPLKYFSCRDTYVVVDGVAYIPQGILERQDRLMAHGFSTALAHANDTLPLEQNFKAQGLRYVALPDVTFDGGNVIVHPVLKTVFMGVAQVKGKNTQDANVSAFQKVLGSDWYVFPVPLVDMNHDPRELHAMAQRGEEITFYHLDKGMSEPLLNGEVLICPDMCPKDIYKRLQNKIGQKSLLRVSREDAERGSLNLISNGNSVIISNPTSDLRGQLEGRGYNVLTAVDVGVDLFDIMDAGPHCATNLMPEPLV